jgi:hypothetical protein
VAVPDEVAFLALLAVDAAGLFFDDAGDGTGRA